jgi:hypothetical protein
LRTVSSVNSHSNFGTFSNFSRALHVIGFCRILVVVSNTALRVNKGRFAHAGATDVGD